MSKGRLSSMLSFKRPGNASCTFSVVSMSLCVKNVPGVDVDIVL